MAKRFPLIVCGGNWGHNADQTKVNVCPVSPTAENLDAMIAMQTKNKLGKSLGPPDFTGPNGKEPHKLPTKHVKHQ